jgi:hypothetical protein
MGVVAILTTIVTVGVRAAFARADDARVEIDARSAHQLHAAWWASHRDEFVNIGEFDPLFRATGRLSNANQIVYLQSLEGRLLHLSYPQQAAHEWWSSAVEVATGERINLSSVLTYGFGFFTDPRLWVDDPAPWTRWADADYYRFVKTSEAHYPAQKGLLIQLPGDARRPESPGNPRPFAIAFVDGSVSRVAIGDAVEPTGGYFGAMPSDPPYPVLYTREGVRGRDVTR